MADILDAAQTNTQTPQTNPTASDVTPPPPPPPVNEPLPPMPPEEPAPVPPTEEPPISSVPAPSTLPEESALPSVPTTDSLIVPPETTTAGTPPLAEEPQPKTDQPLTEKTEEPKPMDENPGENNPQDIKGKGKKKSRLKTVLVGLLLLVITLPILTVFVRREIEIRSRATNNCATICAGLISQPDLYQRCMTDCQNNNPTPTYTCTQTAGQYCSSHCSGTDTCGSGTCQSGTCCGPCPTPTPITPHPTATPTPTRSPCHICRLGTCASTHADNCDPSLDTCHTVGSTSECTPTPTPTPASTVIRCCCAGAPGAVASCDLVMANSCPANLPREADTLAACSGNGSTIKCCCAGAPEAVASCMWAVGSCPANMHTSATAAACSGSSIITPTPTVLPEPCQYSCSYTATQCANLGGTRSPYLCVDTTKVCCNLHLTPTPTRTPTPTPICGVLNQVCCPGNTCNPGLGLTCLLFSSSYGICISATTVTPPPGPFVKCCPIYNTAYSHNTCTGASENACKQNDLYCIPWNTSTCPAELPPPVTPTPNGGGWACGGGTAAAPPFPQQCVNGGTYNGKCLIYHCPLGCGGEKCGENSPGAWWEYGPCATASLTGNECGQIDTVTDEGKYCQPSIGCDTKVLRCSNCSGGPTPPPQCIAIKVYKGGKLLTDKDLASLKPNDTVTLAFKPGVPSTKARFRINGTAWHETTTKNSSAEFIYNWKVWANGVTSFSIEAQGFNGSVWQ